MIKNICSLIYQNKNFIMLVTVGIYILALLGVLYGHSAIVALLLTILLIFLVFKSYMPIKVVLIWSVIFYFGILNTSLRLKNTDSLLNLAPVNSTIYGKILSIPQNKDQNKTQFFFGTSKIEYDGITQVFDNEKVLVTIPAKEKFNIYDSYRIRGRLSAPFKSGNPSQFDYGNYLRNFNTYAVFYAHNPYSMRNSDIPCYEKINLEPNKHEKLLQGINNYREKILNIHSNYLVSPNLEILGGIVFGDDAVSPPKNIKESFINSGLLHILAASGMNVAFIYSFFFLIMNFFRIPFKINVSICILFVLTYVLMTGLGASVLRAALMLVFVLVGKLIDRDANNISLLSFVAFLMLIYNPMYINDVGFQLSFIVTFGLVLTIPYLIQSKYKIVNWLIGSVSIPIIAQFWVIPIQIFYFNNISIYSVFANIMSVPILSVVSFGGFISSLLSIITPISHFICKWFDFILNPLITILINISDFWGNLPHSTMQTTHPNFLQILLYYLILIHVTLIFDKDICKNYIIQKGKYVLSSLFIILFITIIPIPNTNLEITAFDVGNADSFMIKTPDNKYLMIDTGKSGYNGGKSQAEIIMLKYFIDNGIKNIDSIIITHFDDDHSGGAYDLINQLSVNKIYVNSTNHQSNSAKMIYKAAQKHGTKIIPAVRNQTVYNRNGLVITNYITDDTSSGNDNENSILTLIKYGEFSMLFMGDAGIKTFNKLKNDLPQNITVLKVGHHGAAGVISKDMADYLNTKISLFSTGENKFGHPSIYTVETLRNSNILRTDINNSIKFIVKPDCFKVQSYNSEKKRYKDVF